MPTILAHRGASGHQLENSLAAFEAARQLGADGVELDIHVTADGALVVHHDAEIPGLGPIATLTRSAIRRARLENGEPIPELAEALRVLRGMEVWIELKALPPAADEHLLATIDQAPESDRSGVHSFDHRIIARLGFRRPALRRGILSASYPVDPVGPLLDAGANVLWQAWQHIDRDLVAAVHDAGRSLIAWTVNDTPTAQRLSGLGVDGLCGNFPERLNVD